MNLPWATSDLSDHTLIFLPLPLLVRLERVCRCGLLCINPACRRIRFGRTSFVTCMYNSPSNVSWVVFPCSIPTTMSVVPSCSCSVVGVSGGPWPGRPTDLVDPKQQLWTVDRVDLRHLPLCHTNVSLRVRGFEGCISESIGNLTFNILKRVTLS